MWPTELLAGRNHVSMCGTRCSRRNGGATAIAQWQTLLSRERLPIYFRQDNPQHNCTGSLTRSKLPSRWASNSKIGAPPLYSGGRSFSRAAYGEGGSLQCGGGGADGGTASVVTCPISEYGLWPAAETPPFRSPLPILIMKRLTRLAGHSCWEKLHKASASSIEAPTVNTAD